MDKFSMTKHKFKNQWMRHFAPDIPKEQFNKYIDGQFIWHVFSWNLINTKNLLVGDAARKAYDEAEKSECIYCDMFNNGGVTNRPFEYCDTAVNIDTAFSEIYIVAKDYSWTYIKTHESDACGPYFFKK